MRCRRCAGCRCSTSTARSWTRTPRSRRRGTRSASIPTACPLGLPLGEACERAGVTVAAYLEHYDAIGRAPVRRRARADRAARAVGPGIEQGADARATASSSGSGWAPEVALFSDDFGGRGEAARAAARRARPRAGCRRVRRGHRPRPRVRGRGGRGLRAGRLEPPGSRRAPNPATSSWMHRTRSSTCCDRTGPPGASEGFHPWPKRRSTGTVTPCCSPEPSRSPPSSSSRSSSGSCSPPWWSSAPADSWRGCSAASARRSGSAAWPSCWSRGSSPSNPWTWRRR